MKANAIVLGISVFAATAAAADIPSCLQTCYQGLFKQFQCSTGDLKCFCTQAASSDFSDFSAAVDSCTGASSCTLSDLNTWADYWSNACLPYADQIESAVLASLTLDLSSTATGTATRLSAASSASSAKSSAGSSAKTSAASTAGASAGSSAGASTGASAGTAAAASPTGSSAAPSATGPGGLPRPNAAAVAKVERGGIVAAAAALFYVL